MDIRLSQADISDHSWDFPDLVKKESFDSTLIDERCAQRVDRSFLCFRDVKLQVAANRSVGRTFAFSGFFQRVVINHDRNDGSARFRIAGTPMPVARAAPRYPASEKPELKKSTRCFSVFTLTKNRNDVKTARRRNIIKSCKKKRLDINIGEDWQR